MTTHYLFHCPIEAPARQTVRVKLEDLALPPAVIDSLSGVNSTPIRAPLSKQLETELRALRTRQRSIYDECCIFACGQHFLVADCYGQALSMLDDLKKEIALANERLADQWDTEYIAWCKWVRELLSPVIGTSSYFDQACAAYQQFFPTRRSFKNLIRISVLGPLRVDLSPVDKPDESASIQDLMQFHNQENTAAVLSIAKENANDRAAEICANLIDELDAREENPRVSIGRVQTGTSVKRGSWELLKQQIELLDKHVPGYTGVAVLMRKVYQAALDLQSSDKAVAQQAFYTFATSQEAIREEIKKVSERETAAGTEGGAKLHAALSMTSEYKRISQAIRNAPDEEALEDAIADLNAEQAIMTQRKKKLDRLVKQRREYLDALAMSADKVTEQLQQLPKEPDF